MIPPVTRPTRYAGTPVLFARPADTPLRLLVLADTIQGDPALDLLWLLGRDKAVTVLATGDTPEWLPASSVELGIRDDEADQMLVTIDGPSGGLHGVSPASRWEEQAQADARDDPSVDFEARRRLLFQGAVGADVADLTITNDPYLLGLASGPLQQSSVMQPRDAIAVIGLYLRRHRRYLRQAHGLLVDSSGFFYFYASRAVLPTAWRWIGACLASGLDSLANLCWSPILRLDRVLRARDRMQFELWGSFGRPRADEVLFYFDVVLLMLTAAFDGVARVVHHSYNLGKDGFDAGWQKRERWLPKLTSAGGGSLASIVDRGTDGAALIDLLTKLRNEVHGEPPRATTNLSEETVSLEVPSNAEQTVQESIKHFGGDWGYTPYGVSSASLDPGRFIEALLPRAIDLLNELMEANDFSRLGVDTTTILHSPPEDQSFGTEAARDLRRLAGLDLPRRWLAYWQPVDE